VGAAKTRATGAAGLSSPFFYQRETGLLLTIQPIFLYIGSNYIYIEAPAKLKFCMKLHSIQIYGGWI